MTTTLVRSKSKIQSKYQPPIEKEFRPKNRVWVNGRNLYYETFGNPSDPAVLLISGLASQCLHWFSYIYEPLVQQGYYVIRFDNRDVGLSDWTDNNEWRTNSYKIEDMALDAIGLLDRLHVTKAHIIGASIGGMIAQRIAISHPSYVLTIASMHAAAEASKFMFKPYMLSAFDALNPSLTMQLKAWTMLCGSRFAFDKERYQALYHEGFKVRQGYNPQGFIHHLTAIQLSGSRFEELGKIRVPALVVHGTEDPLIPEAHASVYAQEIPHATYLALDGVGHEIPEGVAAIVLEALFNLFSKI
jgi:pimeloyl-ACP methyl ester carboxylesterase